jgi:cobalt-precorrin-7 (C5)-methyltransferase
MHVTTSIEEKKLELQKAIIDGQNIILIPRPWPSDPQRHFMPSEVAFYLKKNGFDTSKILVHVFESLTNGKEQTFTGSVQELEGKEFSDLSVMVISQTKPESYVNF